ncbi:MAG: PIG-L family deacetylase [Gemmatimonadaceae bacterium]|nr:PIG-L family deacetylase [Acetobacteraceae bacterium]
MPAALFLSPHLDDVAFSCGGLLAQLHDAGWHTAMVTAFTATVTPVTGFALACQTDKGLGPEVDYMALRREEDRAAAAILGVDDLRWLDMKEAPHRGYGSAPELFGPMRDDDDVWRPLAEHVAALIEEMRPDLVLAPQGLGDHVDHRQMIRAINHAGAGALAFYRDTPYAIRNPYASPGVGMAGLADCAVGIASGLDRKVAASAAYASQVGFQFGGPAGVGASLRAFAVHEGHGLPAERFLAGDDAAALLRGSLEAAIL